MPTNLNDIDRGPAGVRMGENARPVTGSDSPESPSWGLASERGDVSVKSGGVDYVGPPEVRSDGRCSAMKRSGDPCKAFATRTGLCVGHSRWGGDSDEV